VRTRFARAHWRLSRRVVRQRGRKGGKFIIHHAPLATADVLERLSRENVL
jgi:hypothetical protein